MSLTAAPLKETAELSEALIEAARKAVALRDLDRVTWRTLDSLMDFSAVAHI